jgi:hypothetical protein
VGGTASEESENEMLFTGQYWHCKTSRRWRCVDTARRTKVELTLLTQLVYLCPMRNEISRDRIVAEAVKDTATCDFIYYGLLAIELHRDLSWYTQAAESRVTNSSQ